MSNNPKITFYSGVGTTTGANFLIEFGGGKYLVDCGLLQGVKNADDFNASDFKYNLADIKFLFVTHAHMDHIGRIPKLVKDGFKGKIISTPETKAIAEPLLHDAYKIMISREKGGVSRNFYKEKNIKEALNLWETKEYGEKWQFAENATVVFLDAGHILGSAMVELTLSSIKIVFTGDLGNSPSPLLRDTEIPKDADYIVMESVYGDRNHCDKEIRRERFKKIIQETIEKRGELIIPAFSVDRTQIILYELNNMVEDGEIKSVPVFLDSPLAEKVTQIYRNATKLFNEKIQREIKEGDNIFDFPKLKITTSREESLNVERTPNPKIVIAGSGVSEGGRVLEHEARALSDPDSTILLMGYQPLGTLGRELQDGAKQVTIPHVTNERTHDNFNFPSYQKVKVKAKIESIHGYSAHKDSEHLQEFIGKANQNHKLSKVFIVMGEPKSSLFLIQRIRDYLDINASYPEIEKPYELI